MLSLAGNFCWLGCVALYFVSSTSVSTDYKFRISDINSCFDSHKGARHHSLSLSLSLSHSLSLSVSLSLSLSLSLPLCLPLFLHSDKLDYHLTFHQIHSIRRLQYTEEDADVSLRIAAIRVCLSSSPGCTLVHDTELTEELNDVEDSRDEKYVTLEKLKNAVFPIDPREVRMYVSTVGMLCVFEDKEWYDDIRIDT